MPDFENILYDVAEQVATITLNRPDALNAISPAMEQELHTALDAADADPGVRAIILLTCAERPCKLRLRHRRQNRTRTPDLWNLVPRATRTTSASATADANNVHYLLHLWNITKPIIAAVNGWAMGGGFWYQLAADITIASDRAVFAQPEVRHISNSTYLLAALCGWKTPTGGR